MADDTPRAVKALDHLIAGDVFVGVHSGEVGDVLFAPRMRRASQIPAPRLLLDRPSAASEMYFEVGEWDALIGIHAREIGDFLFGPALLGHTPPFLKVRSYLHSTVFIIQ